MPALDQCHAQVVHALEKAGWRVSPQPYALSFARRRNPLLADIFAQRGEQQIIIVEVKCFEQNTPDELYTAVGQYMVYRKLLLQQSTQYPLFLAVPLHAYRGIFREVGFDLITDLQIKLIVVDLEDEVIVQWLS